MNLFLVLKNMGVPKSKTSRMRARIRRAQWKVDSPNLQICPQCGAYKESHRVCKECGYYRGVKVIESNREKRELREAKKRQQAENK